LSVTGRQTEHYDYPISHYASVYHSGRSDLPQEHVRAEIPTEERTTYEIHGIKKVPEGYPTYHEFLGPLATHDYREFQSVPLQEYSSTYHPGHYTHLEPHAETPTTYDLHATKKTPEGYPAYSVHTGRLSPIHHQEFESTPIQDWAGQYNQGYYEKLEAKPKAPESYPTYQEYIGPLSSSSYSEFQSTPLQEHAVSYHPGHYDSLEVETPEKKTSFLGKLFKHGHAHLMDQPTR
jgi:hypothetical protein